MGGRRKRKPVISSVFAKRRQEIDCVGGLAGFGSGKTKTISSREQTD
jgi:hypothetical protein